MRLQCCDERVINLSSVLRSGPVPDSPLEVGLGVSLDEGVDGANTTWSVMRGGMVSGCSRGCIPWNISPHPNKVLLAWIDTFCVT